LNQTKNILKFLPSSPLSSIKITLLPYVEQIDFKALVGSLSGEGMRGLWKKVRRRERGRERMIDP
jgi:hypothetical protein